MILGEIIKKFRTEHKMSMDIFAKKSGLTKGYISMLEKNEHPKSKKPIIPTDETLKKVARGMDTDLDFILNLLDPDQEIQINVSSSELTSSILQNDPSPQAPDSLVTAINNKVIYLDRELKEPRHSAWISHGERLLDEQNTVRNSTDTVDEPVVTYYTYNYYDQPASAGTGQYLNDVQVEQIELPIEVDADFVVPIYGDSMEPEYHSGDYVFVKLSVNLSNGDIGVFEYYGDAYIKQLLINEGGAFLHSLNSEYNDIKIDRDSDFRIIGEVVGMYREG